MIVDSEYEVRRRAAPAHALREERRRSASAQRTGADWIAVVPSSAFAGRALRGLQRLAPEGVNRCTRVAVPWAARRRAGQRVQQRRRMGESLLLCAAGVRQRGGGGAPGSCRSFRRCPLPTNLIHAGDSSYGVTSKQVAARGGGRQHARWSPACGVLSLSSIFFVRRRQSSSCWLYRGRAFGCGCAPAWAAPRRRTTMGGGPTCSSSGSERRARHAARGGCCGLIIMHHLNCYRRAPPPPPAPGPWCGSRGSVGSSPPPVAPPPPLLPDDDDPAPPLPAPRGSRGPPPAGAWWWPPSACAAASPSLSSWERSAKFLACSAACRR